MEGFVKAGRKTDRSNSKRKRLDLYSMISIAFMAMLLTSVVLWHDETKSNNNDNFTHRSLSTIDEDPPIIDDDGTRSGVCQRFIKKFLNGTTDSADECQAFYNAYREADCANAGTRNSHADMFGNSTNDDWLIDDIGQSSSHGVAVSSALSHGIMHTF